MYKLYEVLTDKEREKLKSMKKEKKNKKKSRMSKGELLDLMDINLATYKRVRGAIRRK